MHKPIPPVSYELLMKGNQAVVDDRDRQEPIDTTILLVAALAGKHSPAEILAVSYRLGALAKLIQDGDGREWTITVLHQSYKLVNEALFRAAASAPLYEAATVGEVSFDPKTFLEVAMRESVPEGNA